MSFESKNRILIVDDEDAIRDVLAASLVDEGYLVDQANNGEKALRVIEEFNPEVVLLDIWMPGQLDGIDVLNRASDRYPQIDFVIMSGHGTIETAVKATKLGAWDFVEKPLSIEKILITIKNIILYQREKKEKEALLSQLRRNIAIIGNSESMKSLKRNISQVAATPNWILVEGEKGVGKFLVAQNIHYLSERASWNFAFFNSKSTPKDLIDIELFGYMKEIFSGAQEEQKGKLDYCHQSTLYINEVCELSLETQEKLFRFMQTQTFNRVGSQTPIEVDVRILFATGYDPQQALKEGILHRDLYNRISIVPIQIPSLKTRTEDILLLAQHFSSYYARESGSRLKEITDEAKDLLTHYSWPGNVRELRNFIERVYILSADDEINVYILQAAGLYFDAEENESVAYGASNLKLARTLFEKQYILRKLEENKGNVSKTAEMIGVERSHLHRKIKSYGIESN